MNEEKKELFIRENDVLAVSFLKQNGNSVQSPFSRDIFLMHTMINGAMHVDGIHKRASKLHEGDRVQLVLEPKNKYDDKAILVKNEKGDKLGYIPRIKNEVLYHLMDAGKYLFGIVKEGDIGEKLDPDDSWIEIYIDVYMVD
ncbi:MAG: HIRAN domain-containing protein [Lachnospiraceae bacterium]|nr:HIRAN domain-containing protein [Lachnospiraceae bacterium]